MLAVALIACGLQLRSMLRARWEVYAARAMRLEVSERHFLRQADEAERYADVNQRFADGRLIENHIRRSKSEYLADAARYLALAADSRRSAARFTREKDAELRRWW